MRSWKTLLGVAVTVGLLWWSFRDLELAAVWIQIRSGDMLLLAAAVAVTTFGFFIRALRWKVLLAEIDPDSGLSARFKAVTIGFMTNNVLPLRLGEFTRALALSQLSAVTVSGAFGTLVVERLLDGAVLVLFLLVVVSLPSFPMAGVLDGGVLGAGLDGMKLLLGGVLVGVVISLIWPAVIMRWVEIGSTFLPPRFRKPLVGAARSFLDSLRVLSRPKLVVLAFVWTLGFWAWNAFSFWLGMKAFGIDLDMLAAMFTQTVVGFGVALPAAPGFAGTFHAAAMWALETPYGVAAEQAGAFAVAYHLASWFPVTGLGLYFAWRMGLSLKELGGGEPDSVKLAGGGSPSVGPEPLSES